MTIWNLSTSKDGSTVVRKSASHEYTHVVVGEVYAYSWHHSEQAARKSAIQRGGQVRMVQHASNVGEARAAGFNV